MCVKNRPWLWSQLIYPYISSGKLFYKSLKILKDFTVNVINKRIESRMLSQKHENTDMESINEDSAQRKKFFLDMLLDIYDKGEIDVEGITEEVDTFMFEGHDTTS